MRVNIVIKKIKNEKARNVIVRHLAAKPSIDLDKAKEMVGSLPLVYKEDIERSEANDTLDYLSKVGVEAQMQKAEADVKVQSMWDDIEKKESHTEYEPRTREGFVAHSDAAAGGIMTDSRLHSESGEKKRNAQKVIMLVVLLIILLTVSHIVMTTTEESGQVNEEMTGQSERFAQQSGADVSGRRHMSLVDTGAPRDSGDTGEQIEKEDKITDRNGISAPMSAAVRYCDSASRAGSLTTKIKFYKIAISFNKYNADAWAGLIEAYREAQMHEKARVARMEMQKLFPGDIGTLQEIVRTYGTLVNTSVDSRNRIRVEYISKKNTKQKLLRESFALIRQLRARTPYNEITLYLHSPMGEKLLVPVDKADATESFRRFIAQQDITYLHR